MSLSILEVLEKKGSMSDVDLQKGAKVKLRGSQLQGTQSGADETRTGEDAVGIEARER